MIPGEVAATREIMVSFAVRDTKGAPLIVRTVVDTGFGGHLMLPPVMVATLGLVQSGTVTVVLGDGSEAYLPEYKAVVIWDGRDRDIVVYVADGDPLVGMELLYGFDFHVHVVDGGMVALNRLP